MQLRESCCYGIDCIEVEIGPYKLTLTESFGPRILRFGLIGGENVFGEHPDAVVETELGRWHPLGGHRLWIAPETKPDSYAPDDHEVEIEEEDDAIDLIAPTDAAGFQKQISIAADERGGLILTHTIMNNNVDVRRVAAWPLTIMRGGGSAYLPMEPFKPHAEELLPVRQLIMWGYTDLTDPRWKIGSKLIELQVDEQYNHPQKIGASNKQGWLAYRVEEYTFVKSFSHEEGEYPDMGSNCEIYTAGSFVELESLSPLKLLQPGESLIHEERWMLTASSDWANDEAQIVETCSAMHRSI